MTSSTEYFTGLITSEHQEKEKFVQTVSLSCQGFADQIALCGIAASLYDLDRAVGVQLDAVGLWVGVTRLVAIDANVYFSWDTDRVGWDQGIWWQVGDAESTVTQLSDADFRNLIRLKILCNNSDGTLPTATKILEQADPNGNATVRAVEGDMTVTFSISGEISYTAINIISGGYIPIKAAGVGTNFSFIPLTIPPNDWGGDIL